MFLFKERKKPLRIITCGVFRHARNRLHLTKRIPDPWLTFSWPSLHLKPEVLQNRLSISKPTITLSLFRDAGSGGVRTRCGLTWGEEGFEKTKKKES